MKTLLKSALAALILTLFPMLASAQEPQEQKITTLTKANDAYIVNTTVIGAGVTGFNGCVPLLITIKNDKVEKIEALPNSETPGFMERAKVLLTKWNGKSVKEAQALEVDAVSGATYTSKAIKENVRLGIEYYQKNK